jgi:hypothetical protein
MNADQGQLDAIVNRLANIQPWNIYSIDEAKDEVNPWFQVSGAVAKDLVIAEAGIEEQVQSLPAQIQHWGRLESQARRVWSMIDRKYRVWRDTKKIELLTPPVDPEWRKDWKKPTVDAMEAESRVDPAYSVWQRQIERAEEAYNATHAVLEGYRAKMEMMKIAVWRRKEDGAPRIGM